MLRYLVFSCFFLFLLTSVRAQDDRNEGLVQFSGLVLDGSNEELLPVPYTNISVLGENRGTYTDWNGFFSIVVRRGQKVEFSAVGYETVEFIVPDTLTDDRYSVVQLMTQDVYNLPETVIFPWPSREHFRLEFLAMDVSSQLQNRALENVAAESLEKMRNRVVRDGNENADYYLRQQAQSYYHLGQAPPMNIFNPIAWKQFVDAWKRGDFKKKDKDR